MNKEWKRPVLVMIDISFTKAKAEPGWSESEAIAQDGDLPKYLAAGDMDAYYARRELVKSWHSAS